MPSDRNAAGAIGSTINSSRKSSTINLGTACGLLLLLWSVAEAMLLPLPREDAVLVAPLQGGAAEVERQIRGCRWMREHRGLRAQIIWIDRGLTPEGQEAAARLLRDAAGEQLCAAGQAAEYLERLGAFEA